MSYGHFQEDEHEYVDYCFYCSEIAHYTCEDCAVQLCKDHTTKIDKKLISLEESGHVYMCPACEVKIDGDFGVLYKRLQKNEDTDTLTDNGEITINEAVEIAADESDHIPHRIELVGNAWVTFNTKVATATKLELYELLTEFNQKVRNAEVLLTRRQVQRGTVQRELREREHIERLQRISKGTKLSTVKADGVSYSIPRKPRVAKTATINGIPQAIPQTNEAATAALRKLYPNVSEDQLKVLAQMLKPQTA